MAEGKSEMSGWRIALNIIGAMLGFLVFGAAGCAPAETSGACSCPKPPNIAVIHLGCASIEPPAVKTTGPCTVCPIVLANGSIPEGASCAVFGDNSQKITLTANDTGTCHVELTFGSGATSSVDLDFTSVWTGCGSDPHGCGEGFVAAIADGSPCTSNGCQVSVPEPMCDAGLDAEASD